MNRREFLKITARLSTYGLATLATGGAGRILFRPRKVEGAIPRPTIVLGRAEDHARLVDSVLAPLGGMKAFVKPGARVVVKPNIGWDRTPEQAANTNPVIVRRVVELALEAGASSVQVFDRPVNDAQRCYVNSGIKKAVESLGDSRARVEYMDKRLFVDMDIQKGASIHSWQFYKPCLTADTFINIPIAKHHSSATLSMALKNMMGPVGGRRGLLHVSLHQRIADLNTVLRPHLHILDATRILTANGPQGGNLSDVRVLNRLGASTDPVALDAWGATLFAKEGASIEHVLLSYKQGLGEIDLDKAKFVRV